MDNTKEKGNEIFRIKKSRNLTPLLAFFALLLACASGYLLYLYFTLDLKMPFEILFLVVGGVGAVYFTVCFFNLLYQVISPKNALLISEDGFLDLINGDAGAGFVSWTNVSRVEMLGDDKPYIGIGLLSVSNLEESPTKKLTSQMEERASKGLPELVIRPFEIACGLEEAFSALRDFRNRYYSHLDAGDTNVFDARKIPGLESLNEFDGLFKEKENENDEDIESGEKSGGIAGAIGTDEDTPLADDDIKIAESTDVDVPAEKTDDTKKSIDELLAELSETIGKKREETSESSTDKAVNDGIEELIKLLKEKK